MTPAAIFKILHLLAAFSLFTSLGVIFADSADSCRKRASMLHGISLLALVGFGLALLQTTGSNGHWWHAKLVIWLLLGAAPVFAKRNLLPRPLLLVSSLLLGAAAAFLALAKPF